MARLKPAKRARLPDRAFAYIDPDGRRRLPIHDKAHVKNALARFTQVKFEDDDARERARKRLLNAAKKFRIVPVGFITAQIRRASDEPSPDVAKLPKGFVTLLMTDIESSTALLRRLGDRYGVLLNDVRGILRSAVQRAGGREIDLRADECFAAFANVGAAIEAALAIQRALGDRRWDYEVEVRVRVGIHSGRPTLTKTGYIGIAVHVAARVCAAAHGGQVLVSGDTRAAVATSPPAGVRFRSLGRHRLQGLAEPEPLFQVLAQGLRASFPPPRIGRQTTARRPAADRGTRARSEKVQLELPEAPA